MIERRKEFLNNPVFSSVSEHSSGGRSIRLTEEYLNNQTELCSNLNMCGFRFEIQQCGGSDKITSDHTRVTNDGGIVGLESN